ncbi:MAG: hypothetical protein R2704_04700 [Microthrixaceae bacterium]
MADLLPSGGLARGATVSVGGSCGAVSLAALLMVEASKAGSWVVAVGMDELNWEAALALGVVAERSVVVRVAERSQATEVMAAVVDAADVVLVGPEVVLAASAVRRLRARARERGSVLIRVQPNHARRAGSQHRTADDRWDGPELSLRSRVVRWSGLGRGGATWMVGCSRGGGERTPAVGRWSTGAAVAARRPGVCSSARAGGAGGAPGRGSRRPRRHGVPGRRDRAGGAASSHRHRLSSGMSKDPVSRASAGTTPSPRGPERVLALWCPDWPVVAWGVPRRCRRSCCRPTGWWRPTRRRGATGW